jgi:hypothetical protein
VKIDSDLTFDRFIEISGSCQAWNILNARLL